MVNISSTTIAGGTWREVIIAALEGREPKDWVRPPGLVEARVCVPSGRVVTPGVECPSVTGTFAAEALALQDDSHWGGTELDDPMNTRDAARTIPADIDGWKRYLAQEYQRSYRSRR
jgi:hypothetical protein